MRPLFAALLVVTTAACGGASTEVSEGPIADPYTTGKDCAPGSGICDHGRCSIEIDNKCTTPVTCKMIIESQCRSDNGEGGPATAKTGQVTQLAGTKSTLEAQTDCGQGAPAITRVQELTCF